MPQIADGGGDVLNVRLTGDVEQMARDNDCKKKGQGLVCCSSRSINGETAKCDEENGFT